MKEWNLNELQGKGLPVATCELIGLHANDADGEALLVTANEYLGYFVAPADTKGEKDIDCPGCGHALGGIFGAFQWGICNGEGECSNCGYPARAIHRIGEPSESGEYPITLERFILAYHPSALATPEPSSERM